MERRHLRTSTALLALTAVISLVGGILGTPVLGSSTSGLKSAANDIRSSNPSFGPTETVSEQAEDVKYDGLYAEAVVGWGGLVTAVWHRPDAEVGFQGGGLFASVRDVDGVWSEPVLVAPTVAFPGAPEFDVAAGKAEAVSVVWAARVDDALRVFEAHRDGLGWSSPVMLGRGFKPQVVMDGLGSTTVLWRHRGVRVVTRTADGEWSSPRVLAKGTDPRALAGNRAGDEALLWTQKGYTPTKATFRARTSQVWPQGLTVYEGYPSYVTLAVDPRGRVLAVWSAAGDIWWVRRSLDGRWSPARKIAGDVGRIGANYGWLGLSVNRRGRGLLWWMAGDSWTHVARYRPGHGFGDPVHLSRNRWRTFQAVGSPLLTAGGTAVVAGQLEYGARVAYRWQTPGEPWSTVHRLDVSQAVNAVGARGTRMVILFQAEGLRARVMDLG